jgi:TolA-binding protein
MGDTARAKAGFEDFIKREPQHPLAKDAEQALAALK